MVGLLAAGICRDIEVIVLDKDGTLTDFNSVWGQRYVNCVDAVVEGAHGDSSLRASLYRALAINAADGCILQDNPIVSVKITDKGIIVATVLHQFGVAWEQAQSIVAERMLPILTQSPQPHQTKGIGNVKERVWSWKTAGLRLAIATNDNQTGTLAELSHLGIDDAIDMIVCADSGMDSKPSPAALLHIAKRLGAMPNRLAMVGDTATDLLAGRSAGAGMVVGVLSGLGTHGHLAPLADAIVTDIHGLTTAS
jgi:phosphoglycolate phosphatase-like HAD superfamily hydrolase